MKMKMAVAAALALSASPAAAEDWPMLDDWNFTQLEKGCEMWTTYDGTGETLFSVYQQPDGFTLLAISNTEWPFEDGESYEATFVLGDADVISGSARGMEVDNYHGLFAPVSADIPTKMRDIEFIEFHAESGIMDELDIAGSSRALDRFAECIAAVGQAGS